MKITTTFKTKRNYSPVIKINDEKYFCLDKGTLQVYRTCTDPNELFEVNPYDIDFDFTKFLQKNEEIVNDSISTVNKVKGQLNEFRDKINFIQKTLNIPDIYNHCIFLSEQRKKEAAIEEKKRIQSEAKSVGLTVKEYLNFMGIIRAKNFKNFA